MEDSNKRNRYPDDNHSSSHERRPGMNWDRNYTPGDDRHRPNNPNKNVYSSDRERENWMGRNNRMNNWSPDRNYNDYDNRNRPSGDFRRNDYEDFRSQRYNMNDNYMNHPDRNYGNYNDPNHDYDDYNSHYDDYGNRYRNENRGWWDRTKDEVASWFGDDDAERRRRRDEMQSGQHRGKGPKNYTRSEERIKEDVSDILTDDSFLDASDIEVNVKASEVTLNGYVDTLYSKHRSEDLAEDITGVTHVQNNLRVHENPDNSDNVINKENIQNKSITPNTNDNTSKNSNRETSKA